MRGWIPSKKCYRTASLETALAAATFLALFNFIFFSLKLTFKPVLKHSKQRFQIGKEEGIGLKEDKRASGSDTGKWVEKLFLVRAIELRGNDVILKVSENLEKNDGAGNKLNGIRVNGKIGFQGSLKRFSNILLEFNGNEKKRKLNGKSFEQRRRIGKLKDDKEENGEEKGHERSPTEYVSKNPAIELRGNDVILKVSENLEKNDGAGNKLNGIRVNGKIGFQGSLKKFSNILLEFNGNEKKRKLNGKSFEQRRRIGKLKDDKEENGEEKGHERSPTEYVSKNPENLLKLFKTSSASNTFGKIDTTDGPSDEPQGAYTGTKVYEDIETDSALQTVKEKYEEVEEEEKEKRIQEQIELEEYEKEEPKEKEDVRCPNNTLSQQAMASYGKCEPHKPLLEGCKTAQRLYKLNQGTPKCKEPYEGDICSVDVLTNNKDTRMNIRCNRNLCRKGRKGFIVKSMNHSTGEHDIIQTFSKIGTLEKALPEIIEKNIENKYNYVILQCTKNNGNGTVVMQLLPINPRFTIQGDTTKRRQKNAINVNIILIDSVSRAHFYRSLPKTVELFKKWTRESDAAPAKVFDFELFQAVEGHTAENTQALFTGKLFPPKSDRDSTRAVEMEYMFGHYQRAGYQTMWQEDLCWKGYWGLLTDLALGYNWKNLADKLEEVFIDHTGITHSSCEVLSTYGLDNPFNGPPGNQICYNGRFQHTYFLNYTLDTLKAIGSSPSALPLLSYMSLSVGHDQLGRRIQTFDPALVKYMNEIGRDDNTLTILLADHGNTYTEYTVSIQEGRFEMFHPSLFIIVPNKVARLLGDEAITALRSNQRRLITMIDLHHSLMALAGPLSGRVKPVGVFTPISPERICDSVELRTPNLCVCEGWDSPTTNDTLKTAVAEFAIGQLNNRLQSEYMNSSLGNLPLLRRSCHRLQATNFDSVRERNSKADGSLITSMNIKVPAGNVVTHQEDIFHVEVKSKFSPDQDSLDMELVHYERLSMFGKYKVCADKNINAKLCVCSRRSNNVSKTNRELKKYMIYSSSHFFNGKTRYKRLDRKRCLYLIKRVHGKGDAYGYEVLNMCLDRMFTVSLTYRDTNNIKISTRSPVLIKASPGTITFVLSAMKRLSYYESGITVDAEILNTRLSNY